MYYSAKRGIAIACRLGNLGETRGGENWRAGAQKRQYLWDRVPVPLGAVSGVNASSKLGGRSAEGCREGCSLPTGEESERGQFFVLGSKNGVFW